MPGFSRSHSRGLLLVVDVLDLDQTRVRVGVTLSSLVAEVLAPTDMLEIAWLRREFAHVDPSFASRFQFGANWSVRCSGS